MSETEVRRAEQQVRKNQREFEHAVERLEDRVGSTVNTVTKPKRALQHYFNRSREIASPYVDIARDRSRRVVTQVRANPRPFLYGALAFVGGALLFTFIKRRQSLYAGRPSEGISFEEGDIRHDLLPGIDGRSDQIITQTTFAGVRPL